MKRLFLVLAFILAACPFLSACGEVKAPPASPAVSNTAPAPKPTATITPGPSGEGDEIGYDDLKKIRADLQEFYSGYIEDADKCRIKVGNTTYYLDTSKVIEMDVYPEFPLYRFKEGAWPEYLGTTGFAFQVFGGYIYLKSNMRQLDWPDGTLTRVVNLNDLSVTEVGRHINIFLPEQGSKVYYTWEDDCIYVADASLKDPTKLHIQIPDNENVKEKVEPLSGCNIDELIILIGITDVKDGWIYFTYWLWEYEGPTYYEGNYRIKTDGSKIVKIGEGKFEDEIDSED